MLGKIASAGQNGAVRTSVILFQLMVELTAPTAGDVICDRLRTCGFFGDGEDEYLRSALP
jgi:type I restriction enzyme M protein